MLLVLGFGLGWALDMGMFFGRRGMADGVACSGQPNQTNSAPACGRVEAVSGFRGRPTSFFLREVVHCDASLVHREQADAELLLEKIHFSFRAWHLSHARRSVAIGPKLRCLCQG